MNALRSHDASRITKPATKKKTKIAACTAKIDPMEIIEGGDS